MDAVEWTTLGTVLAITLIPGSAAVARGWLVPWLRGRVLSPRLWGAGTIMTGIGAAIGVIAPHGRSQVAALCILAAGLGLTALAHTSAGAGRS